MFPFCLPEEETDRLLVGLLILVLRIGNRRGVYRQVPAAAKERLATEPELTAADLLAEPDQEAEPEEESFWLISQAL